MSTRTLDPLLVINQGESAIYSIRLLDQSGDSIDATEADAIEGETRIDGNVYQKYTTEDPAPNNYETIEVGGSGMQANEINIYVSREQSRNFTAGKNLYLNLLVKMPEGSTPLYYNLSYIIARTDKGTLLTSNI